MGLNELVLKLGNIPAHLLATGLAIAAVKNIYMGIATGQQSYYQFAAIEALVSVHLEIRQYFDRKERRIHQKHIQNIHKHIQEIQKINQGVYDKLQESNS